MGVDIAKAALAAGHAVVATGRNAERVSSALGAHDDLLALKLDVTSLYDATDAVRAAVDRFGRIGQSQPPLRFVAGADAVAAVEKKANNLIAEADAHREVSSNLALDNA